MNRVLSSILAVLVLLAASAASMAAEIQLKDGRTWRGDVFDQVTVTFIENNVEVQLEGRITKIEPLYVVLETKIAGATRDKVVFRADIKSMRTLGAGDDAGAESGKSSGREDARRSASGKASARQAGAESDDVPRSPDGRELGVFVLPLRGPVGVTFRHNEIKMLGEHLDEEYGPGQTIVLIINSNGGLVSETEEITRQIWELKKRHRVVAWVEKAFSAGCATAMVCDEIYFTTEGAAGAVTTIFMTSSGAQSVPEEQVQDDIDFLVKVAKESGYSEHIARAMKLKKYMVSYDKDPETGEITWYGDTSGEFVLSDGDSNLSFNSSNAVHCGFAKGVADTEAELAALLDLPKWHEIDDFGREIADDWAKLVERCQEEVPLLLYRKQYLNASAGAEVRLGTIIRLNEQLIRWWDRCPLIMGGMAPPKEYLERENEELRRQLARMRG